MAIFDEKFEIRERCKGVHCVDLGESFQTHIYLQILVSIQPRTSPPKFGQLKATRPAPAGRQRARGGTWAPRVRRSCSTRISRGGAVLPQAPPLEPGLSLEDIQSGAPRYGIAALD